MGRTVPCTQQTRAGRLAKAEQFLDAAETVAASTDEPSDVGDACVTLLVHAGIAASDVVCCARLGVHAVGESHAAAADLLGKVDRSLAQDLRALLSVKAKAGYNARPVSRQDQTRAQRSARRLVEAARLATR